MKIKIPLLFIIVGLQSTFAQVGSQRENKSHVTDMQLLGKVKTFKITPYKLVDYFGEEMQLLYLMSKDSKRKIIPIINWDNSIKRLFTNMMIKENVPHEIFITLMVSYR